MEPGNPTFTPLTAIVLATRNQGKIKEFSQLLQTFGLRVLGLDDFPEVQEVEETGVTFAENALLKATQVSRATGLVALADDSGLEVDALGGAPGVYSARYSQTPDAPATDARNLEKVLAQLQGVPQTQRGARFRCCMAAATPRGDSLVADGAWEGSIAEEPRGHNGFGYDPVFYDADLSCTGAQMDGEQKNKRSHRAKAVAALLEKWPDFWGRWAGA